MVEFKTDHQFTKLWTSTPVGRVNAFKPLRRVIELESKSDLDIPIDFDIE